MDKINSKNKKIRACGRGIIEHTVISSRNQVKLSEPIVISLFKCIYRNKITLIASWNTVKFIQATLTASGNTVKLTQPTVIPLLYGSTRNKINRDSLGKLGKAHITHGDGPFWGFVLQRNPRRKPRGIE
jgi:hypothetical protein